MGAFTQGYAKDYTGGRHAKVWERGRLARRSYVCERMRARCPRSQAADFTTNLQLDSRALTRSLSALPSTVLPSSRGRTAFITAPISFIEVAPSAATVSSTARLISSSVAEAGR